jgi:integrase
MMPHLGSKVRDDVEPDDVRRMLAALKKCGLSDGTVSRTLDVARQLLPKAATEGVKFRIKVRRRMKIATRQQAAAIEAAIDPRYRLFARTLFTTGCRWGEAVAPPRHRRRAARYGLRAEGSAYGRGGRPRLLGARIRQDRGPMRDITIPGDLASPGVGGIRLRTLLYRPQGDYLKRSTFRKVFWLPAIEEAGIPGLRVNDTRNSAISWWVSARIPLGDVRDRAGHSSISVTNNYVHAVPGDHDPFLAVLGEAT